MTNPSAKYDAADNSGIINTNRPHGYINFQQIESTIRNSRDTRVVALTFSWNFGKLKGVNSRGHGGARDEESRVKSGEAFGKVIITF
jgi:hypothetical protein